MGYIYTKNELIQLIYRVGFVNSNYNIFFGREGGREGGGGRLGGCIHTERVSLGVVLQEFIFEWNHF